MEGENRRNEKLRSVFSRLLLAARSSSCIEPCLPYEIREASTHAHKYKYGNSTFHLSCFFFFFTHIISHSSTHQQSKAKQLPCPRKLPNRPSPKLFPSRQPMFLSRLRFLRTLPRTFSMLSQTTTTTLLPLR